MLSDKAENTPVLWSNPWWKVKVKVIWKRRQKLVFQKPEEAACWL